MADQGNGGRVPDPIDVHVGRRIRARRKALHLSQQDLADRIGISFQQVQKYENGQNRISASRLFDVSRVLGVSVEHFFADLGDEVVDDRPAYTGHVETVTLKRTGETVVRDPLARAETARLIQAFWDIDCQDTRARIMSLTEAVAGRD